MRRTILIFAVLSAAASLAMAGGEVSSEKGMELFTSKQLGTNGKSCSSCHPGGKGLEESAGLSEEELAGVVNQCIQKPLEGKALDPASAEMKSLIAYLRSLSPAEGK